jgi:large subunit ribosomal protein L6
VSRVAKNPVAIPNGVEVRIEGQNISIKGKHGALNHSVHELVQVSEEQGEITISAKQQSRLANSLAGTSRAVISNMVTGVTEGFERKLVITGVGYRAQSQGKVLNLSLGYSHPINYQVPEGITIETPSQTEIVVKGTERQKVGQVAAEIRAFRQPEPYKGVAYANETIVRKEAKKS